MPQNQFVHFHQFTLSCFHLDVLLLFQQIIQLVLGIVAIVLAIVNMLFFAAGLGNFFAMIASGIWTGCMVRCCSL